MGIPTAVMVMACKNEEIRAQGAGMKLHYTIVHPMPSTTSTSSKLATNLRKAEFEDENHSEL